MLILLYSICLPVPLHRDQMDVGFINDITGTVMYVHESRVDEYKAAGYKLAADDSHAEQPAKPAKKKSSKK